MKLRARLTRALYDEIRADLLRPHPFAEERVGFVAASLGNADGADPLVLLHSYQPVPDERYIDDPKTGARIDASAIRNAMQRVLDERQGIFHVHMHFHKGPTRFSRLDRAELPRLVASFRGVGPGYAHGLLMLSYDHGFASVWLPGREQPMNATRVTVVGRPLTFWEDESL